MVRKFKCYRLICDNVKKSNVKSVIGFTVSYIRSNAVYTDLLYVLIDKQYRRLGYDSKLLRFTVGMIDCKKQILIIVRVNNNNSEWYIKMVLLQ